MLQHPQPPRLHHSLAALAILLHSDDGTRWHLRHQTAIAIAVTFASISWRSWLALARNRKIPCVAMSGCCGARVVMMAEGIHNRGTRAISQANGTILCGLPAQPHTHMGQAKRCETLRALVAAQGFNEQARHTPHPHPPTSKVLPNGENGIRSIRSVFLD